MGHTVAAYTQDTLVGMKQSHGCDVMSNRCGVCAAWSYQWPPITHLNSFSVAPACSGGRVDLRSWRYVPSHPQDPFSCPRTHTHTRPPPASSPRSRPPSTRNPLTRVNLTSRGRVIIASMSCRRLRAFLSQMCRDTSAESGVRASDYTLSINHGWKKISASTEGLVTFCWIKSSENGNSVMDAGNNRII